jgi:hypothetical protein
MEANQWVVHATVQCFSCTGSQSRPGDSVVWRVGAFDAHRLSVFLLAMSIALGAVDRRGPGSVCKTQGAAGIGNSATRREQMPNVRCRRDISESSCQSPGLSEMIAGRRPCCWSGRAPQTQATQARQ